MGTESSHHTAPVAPARRSSARTPEASVRPTPAVPELDPGGPFGAALGDGSNAGQPADVRPNRPEMALHAFSSVICASDTTVTDDAARRQAARLKSPESMLELVPASRMTRCGERELRERCDGYDLLALGATADAIAAAQQASIPTLIARRCPLGTEVTDTIVVAVDDSSESSGAVQLAGRLAAANGSTITILAAPPLDRALARAVAASFRVLLTVTGEVPRVFGEPQPPERTVPSAAVALNASLVVVGCGRDQSQRATTAAIIAATGCSILTVPVPEA
jgi:nucleotide-binding universal stress UspA family protein